MTRLWKCLGGLTVFALWYVMIGAVFASLAYGQESDEYPSGLDAVAIEDHIADWLIGNLAMAGSGDEQLFCLYGEVRNGVARVTAASEAVALKVSPESITALPCPPSAIAQAHTHTKFEDSAGVPHTCWWSIPDARTFKSRSSLYGTSYAFDVVVCWNKGTPSIVWFDWDSLRDGEEEWGSLPVYSHDFFREFFLNEYEVDIDTLYADQ